jgi:hypothetical protein
VIVPRRTVLAVGLAAVVGAASSGWLASRPNATVTPARREVVRSATRDVPSSAPLPEDGAEPQRLRTRALGDLLLDSAPPGFVEVPSSSGPAGAFDLETLVARSDHPERERAVLSENRFVRGYARSWQMDAGDGPHRIVASVFEFEDVSHAVVFLMEKREETIAEDAGDRFPVQAGIGLRFAHDVDDGIVHGYTVAFHEDNLVFYLGALYPSEQPPDEVLALEARQRARLEQSRTDAA